MGGLLVSKIVSRKSGLSGIPSMGTTNDPICSNYQVFQDQETL